MEPFHTQPPSGLYRLNCSTSGNAHNQLGGVPYNFLGGRTLQDFSPVESHPTEHRLLLVAAPGVTLASSMFAKVDRRAVCGTVPHRR